MRKQAPKKKSNLNTYQEFVGHMQQGRYRKAFRIFSKSPSIVNNMRMAEFTGYFRIFWTKLGGDEAALFEIAMRAAFEHLLKKALAPERNGTA
jgi:hypothetical protein